MSWTVQPVLVSDVVLEDMGADTCGCIHCVYFQHTLDLRDKGLKVWSALAAIYLLVAAKLLHFMMVGWTAVICSGKTWCLSPHLLCSVCLYPRAHEVRA